MLTSNQNLQAKLDQLKKVLSTVTHQNELTPVTNNVRLTNQDRSSIIFAAPFKDTGK